LQVVIRVASSIGELWSFWAVEENGKLESREVWDRSKYEDATRK
jgi:hypothetical protein